ncbi:MAG: hypothetical protein HKN75_11610, partial [Bacteroidia bacterium]|nr:hypothetical protein [Bacteroidia bacterium]
VIIITPAPFYKYILTSILLLGLNGFVFAQSESAALPNQVQLENTINQLCDSIQKAKTDEVRTAANDSLKSIFNSLLQNPESFNLVYETIDKVSIISSDDKKLRLYSWVLPATDGSVYKYNGFAQFQKSKKHKMRFYEFTEKPILNNEEAEKEKTDNANWYGAVYYKIIDTGKKKKRYYTILGWHGNNLKTTTKLIDVMQPRSRNISFGKSVFKSKEGTKQRIIFEYNFRVSMLLRYQKNKKRIVFDNIAPADSNQVGSYENYGPDLSVNSYNYKKGKWYFEKDVDARNTFKNSGKVPEDMKSRDLHNPNKPQE